MEASTFRFGAWQVDPSDNSISDGQDKRQMEPRAMDVLVALCKQSNTIVSPDQLLEQCWGSTLYGDNPVHKIITQLRKVLGDKSSAPEYIETIRKRGYRTLAPVTYDYSETSQVGTWIKESPFRGLQAFDEKHAPIFFGRSDAIYHLNQIITRHTIKQDSVELFMILGPSGSGKSSLVRAGLIPSMMQSQSALQIASHSSFDFAEQGEHSLFTTLAGMLLDLEIAEQGLFPTMSADTLGKQLQEHPDAVIATLQASLLKLTPPPGRSITYRHALFLDRFEATFDPHRINAQEKDQFLSVLDKLARSHAVMVLLACRNDFYPHIAASPILMEAKARGAHYDLNPPSHAEIAQMIRLPALAARLSFGVDEQSKVRLDDVLCEGTSGNPDALPLLQYTLHELYRLRSQDGELTFAAFNELGGIEGAIGQRAEQVIHALAEEQKQALPQVLSLVTTISTNENLVTSRRAAWAQLNNDNERAVVNALVESRLFVSELVDGAPGFGVAHEALLRRWPRVVEWINSHRSALQIRGRISELAERWQSEGRSQDLLLPEGKQLDEAQSLLTLTSFSLSIDEQALIAASSVKARRRKNLGRGVMFVIMMLALLAIVLGLSAMSAKKQAQERRLEAEGLMGYMLGDFLDSLKQIGKLDLLDSVGEKALSYFAKSDEEDLSPTALTQRARALQVIATNRIDRGNPKAAQEPLEFGRKTLLKQLAENPNDQQVLKNLGENAFWIAQIHLDKGELAEASIYYHLYQDYSGQLAKIDPTNVEWWIEQSYAHVNLGMVAQNLRDFQKANTEFQRALELKKKALEKRPLDRTLITSIGNNLLWLGTVNQRRGELTLAMEKYQESIEIVNSLYQTNPAEGALAGDLSRAYLNLGGVKRALGLAQEARNAYIEAIKPLAKILQEEPENRTLAASLLWEELDVWISDGQLNRGNGQTRLNSIVAIEKKSAALVKLNPENEDWLDLHAWIQVHMANQFIKLKQVSIAKDSLSAAEKTLVKLVKKNESNIDAKLHLIDALLLQADIESLSPNVDTDRKTCHRGLALLSQYTENSADYRVLDRAARLYSCLGDEANLLKVKSKLSEIAYRDLNYLNFIDVKNTQK